MDAVVSDVPVTLGFLCLSVSLTILFVPPLEPDLDYLDCIRLAELLPFLVILFPTDDAIG